MVSKTKAHSLQVPSLNSLESYIHTLNYQNFHLNLGSYSIGSSELKLQNITQWERLKGLGSHCSTLQQVEDPECPDGVASIT